MKLSKKRKQSRELFAELVNIMEKLRSKKGCPWDKHQTHSTLMKYLYSEADEVRSAVRKKDWENLKEELGDVLLQVVFHAQIAKENGLFDISDVVAGINEKLIRRHPHVFSGEKITSAKDVIKRWEEIKKLEKQSKTKPS